MTSRLAVNSLQWMCANIAAASSKGGGTKRRGGSSNIWSGSSKKPNTTPEQPSINLHTVVSPETHSNNFKPNCSDATTSTPCSNVNIQASSSNSSLAHPYQHLPIRLRLKQLLISLKPKTFHHRNHRSQQKRHRPLLIRSEMRNRTVDPRPNLQAFIIPPLLMQCAEHIEDVAEDLVVVVSRTLSDLFWQQSFNSQH